MCRRGGSQRSPSTDSSSSTSSDGEVSPKRRSGKSPQLGAILKLIDTAAAERLPGPPGGPKKAIAALNPGGMELVRWRKIARLTAVIAPGERAPDALKTVLRRWFEFCKKAGIPDGRQFPVTTPNLLRWSTCFQLSKTYGNYCTALKTISELLFFETKAFDSQSVKRARQNIDRRCNLPKREVGHVVAEHLRAMTAAEGTEWSWMVLFILAYHFLMRVPSEALPLVWAGTSSFITGKVHSIVCGKRAIGIRFPWRKNLPRGGTLWDLGPICSHIGALDSQLVTTNCNLFYTIWACLRSLFANIHNAS